MEKVKNYELSQEDFERFRRLINQASGIFFNRGKMSSLRQGLADRAKMVGAVSLADYYDRITTEPNREEELGILLAHLSVPQTQFFRNLPQFDSLRKFVIPEIIRRKSSGHRVIRFWCAGCSTGQEPYSVAMSVLDVLPEPDTWNIQILGTDLNEQALEVARRGWYPEKMLPNLDRYHIEQYFRPHDDGYKIVEPVRRLVEFNRHNLVSDTLPIDSFGTCDVVFCRNVIVYFNHETAQYVIDHFFDILNPGGYLFLGHSETLWKMSAKYSLVEIGDAFIYRKPLPMSLSGRRFIADRRIRDAALPSDVAQERRTTGSDRRAGGHTGQKTFPWQNSVAGVEETDPPHRAAIGKARVQLDLGEYDNAIQSLEEAIKHDNENAEAHLMLGIAHESKNALAEAAHAYQKAICYDADLSLAHFHLANLMERTGQLKGAIYEYRCAAIGFKDGRPGAEDKHDAVDIEPLLDLCEWKIENLGGLG